MGDTMVAEEILLFIESLKGITSTVKSDHILNLFQEVEGTLPEDKEQMTSIIKRFLSMRLEEQMLYQIGRRTGIFSRLEDLGSDMQNANPYGWKFMRPIIRPFAGIIIKILGFLHENLQIGYGWVLIIFGIIMRIVLFPNGFALLIRSLEKIFDGLHQHLSVETARRRKR